MSCRETKANSAMTSLAKAASGLDDADIQAQFHTLKREGADQDTPAPDRDQYVDFLWQQRRLLDEVEGLTSARKDSIKERLTTAWREATDGGPLPDGATYYALRNVLAHARTVGETQAADRLAQRLPGMSPAEVDTELATKWEALYKLQDAAEMMRRDVQYAERRVADAERRGTLTDMARQDLARAQANLATQEDKIARARRGLRPYDREYMRRGGWSRYYLVTNQNGHLHTSMDECPTTFASTRFAWTPELSGKDEAAAVTEFGEKCCTVCMPTAPTNPAFRGPGRRDRAAQEARQAERDRKAAEKAAKAITRPDGRALRDTHGYPIKTLVTARNNYVSNQAYVAHLRKIVAEPPAHVRNPEEFAASQRVTIANYERNIAEIEEALAAKTGQTVEEIRAEAAPKVARKVRRGEW